MALDFAGGGSQAYPFRCAPPKISGMVGVLDGSITVVFGGVCLMGYTSLEAVEVKGIEEARILLCAEDDFEARYWRGRIWAAASMPLQALGRDEA